MNMKTDIKLIKASDVINIVPLTETLEKSQVCNFVYFRLLYSLDKDSIKEDLLSYLKNNYNISESEYNEYKSIFMNREFTNIDFSNLDLSSINFEYCRFENCLFEDTDITYTNFSNCNINNCVFKNCENDINNNKLYDWIFTQNKVMVDNRIGICNTLITNSTFESDNFNYIKIFNSNIIKSSFSNCNFKSSLFSYIHIDEMDFNMCNIDDCRLDRIETDFEGTINIIKLTDSKITDSKITNSYIVFDKYNNKPIYNKNNYEYLNISNSTIFDCSFYNIKNTKNDLDSNNNIYYMLDLNGEDI